MDNVARRMSMNRVEPEIDRKEGLTRGRPPSGETGVANESGSGGFEPNPLGGSGGMQPPSVIRGNTDKT